MRDVIDRLMEDKYEKLYIEVADYHFWMRARRDIILLLLQKQNVHPSSQILDIGCASGVLLKKLIKLGYKNVTGIDVSENVIKVAKEDGIPNVYAMDATQTSFQDNSFDILIASDVLEHIEDDIKALKEWYRILKSGGKAIVFVPAFQFLWSDHDLVCRHFRRYTKNSLQKKMEKVGYKIIRASYWNFSLFFPAALRRMLKKLFPPNETTGDLKKHSPFINGFFYSILKFENNLLRFLNFPLGLSVFVIGEKEK